MSAQKQLCVQSRSQERLAHVHVTTFTSKHCGWFLTKQFRAQEGPLCSRRSLFAAASCGFVARGSAGLRRRVKSHAALQACCPARKKTPTDSFSLNSGSKGSFLRSHLRSFTA